EAAAQLERTWNEFCANGGTISQADLVALISHRRCEQLQSALREVLRQFDDGETHVRGVLTYRKSDWVSVDTLNRWKRILKEVGVEAPEKANTGATPQTLAE